MDALQAKSMVSMDVDMAQSPLLFDWRQTRGVVAMSILFFQPSGTHLPDEPNI
jgi:hypothetical protein